MKQISVLLCFRYLQHRRIVLLSITAVALSCALLIATDSLFTGFICAVENSVGQHLGDIILETPANHVITDYNVLIASLQEADCIRSATAVLSSQGLLLSAPGKVRAVRIWGIELPRRLEVTPLQDSLLFQKDKPAQQVGFEVPGAAEKTGGIAGIGVLTRPDEITDEYDIESVKEMLGQSMMLTCGAVSYEQNRQDQTAPRFSRRVVRFALADVMMTGVNDFDESFVMLPLEYLSGQLYPQSPPAANIIHIRLANGADEAEAMAIVRGLWNNFAKPRFAWYDFVSIESARAMQARLIAEYKKQMGVLLLIFGLVSMGIILLVFCIFYLIVMTRRKDIGILKSCGLSSFSVAAMFVLFGTIVGLIGAGAGIGLGWLIIDNINAIEQTVASVFGIKLWKASTYLFSRIPNTMHWGSVTWITACSIGAAAAGSLIPAIAAARIRPVEILQYE